MYDANGQLNRKAGEEIFVQILKMGSTGSEVALLKKGLNRAGYGPLSLTGFFDEITEQALRDFQRFSGLLDF